MSRWSPSNPINQHICQRIAQRRSKTGMSQSAVAEALNLSYQQYQKYESGGNSLSAAKLWHLARLFDVPVAWFFEECE